MMKKDLLQNKLIKTLGVSVLLIASQACTDLEPNFGDSVSVESDGGSFSGVSSTSASLEALYTSGDSDGIGLFRQDSQENAYALMEVSADNIAVLTRGADWGDNGVWRTMHNHTWDANHVYVLQAWNRHNAASFRASQLLDSRSNASASETAQALVIRAFNIYSILDFFGQVPIRGVDDGPDVNPTVLSAQEAFDLILNDLNTAISSGDLADNGPGAPLRPEGGGDRGGTLSGIGEAFARFLRARVQLNAIHLVGTEGDMNQVVSDVDAIEALGFQLDGIGAQDPDGDESYYDIWDPGNNTNQEVIFMLDGDIRTRMYNQLHPNQGGWNGFVTLTETFRLFGTDDIAQDARLGLPGEEVSGVSTGYIRGQQRNVSGNNLTDRQENPLIYEDVILTNLEVNNERNGIRIVKNPQRNADGNLPGDTARDFSWMRFADAMLMRAEANLRGGAGGSTAALSDVNDIRERAGASALTSVTLDDMPDIIARELNAEGVMGGRRAVQLRFGTYTSTTWEMKNVTDDFRVKFPIPAAALATNPNLVQNPGY